MPSPTVIVTGASRGLGAAAARALSRMGANVTLNARSAGPLEELAEALRSGGSRALAVPGDISKPGTSRSLVDQTLEAFGQLDAIVNNAGVLQPIAPITEGEPDAWKNNLLVNVLGPVMLTQAALPALRTGRGRALTVSSGAAVKVVQGWAAYCSAKAAINHFNRILAAEEPEITAIALRPGAVDTAMQAAIREEGGEGMTEQAHQKYVRRYKEDELLPAELPGRALAVLALQAPRAMSGEFISWDDDAVQALVGEHYPEEEN